MIKKIKKAWEDQDIELFKLCFPKGLIISLIMLLFFVIHIQDAKDFGEKIFLFYIVVAIIAIFFIFNNFFKIFYKLFQGKILNLFIVIITLISIYFVISPETISLEKNLYWFFHILVITIMVFIIEFICNFFYKCVEIYWENESIINLSIIISIFLFVLFALGQALLYILVIFTNYTNFISQQ